MSARVVMMSALFGKNGSAQELDWWETARLRAAILPPGRGHDAPHLAARRHAANVGLAVERGHLQPVHVAISEPCSRTDEQRDGSERHEREALSSLGSAGTC